MFALGFVVFIPAKTDKALSRRDLVLSLHIHQVVVDVFGHNDIFGIGKPLFSLLPCFVSIAPSLVYFDLLFL